MGVVGAVEPADGHEVRELPDEEDGEERHGGPLDDTAGGGPSDEGRERAGEGSDEGVKRGDALERSVDGDVGDGGDQGQGAGKEVGGDGEVDGASADQHEAHRQAVRQADAVLRHGTRGGARHAAVGAALEGLVERAGAGGDESDAEEGLDEPELEGGDARRE